MKKVIFSVLMIAIVGSLVGIGTWAYFSDYETSPDNIFTAGSLDLKVDGEDDPLVTYFDSGCLKPGDEGMVEINLMNVGCVDGVADIHLKNMVSDDNGLTEPESDVDATGGPGEGELCCNLDMRISADLFTAPPAPPVINGALGSGEWDGAVSYSLVPDDPGCPRSYTVYATSDDEFLYVAFDYGHLIGSDFVSFGTYKEGAFEHDTMMGATVAPIGSFYDIIEDVDDDGLSFADYRREEATYDWSTDTATEMAVPLADLGIAAGDTIKITFGLNEDPNRWGETHSGFCYPEGAIPIDPDTFADYTLPTLPTGGDGIFETLVAEGKACDIECSNFEIGDLPGESDIDIMIEWWIDTAVGNIIQTDDCSFDIEFSLNQKIGEVIMDVTDIIQEPEAMVCEVYTIELVVHNAGTIAGNGYVFVKVEDATGAPVWGDKAYVEGLAPCSSTTLTFTWHPTEPGIYTVVADEMECPVEIFSGAALIVTGIQQPETIQICEDLVVAVDIHNAGDIPGGGQLVAAVLDPDLNPLAVSGAAIGEMNPCDVDKIAIDFGHVEPWWRGVVIVVAGFPANPLDPQPEEMFPCPIMVLSPPIFVVTGIQQPDVVQPCEEIIIGVDIHNDGDKPGMCEVVTMWIEDEMGMMIHGPVYGSTIVLKPCDTDKVLFGPIHISELWLGQTITVFAQACGGEPVTCDIVVAGGPYIVVTGIQQPESIEVCENLTVAIDIHNAGGKTGECNVYVELVDDLGAPIDVRGPIPTGVMLPCDTDKIIIDFGHVDESWVPGVTVVAWACDQVVPFECPIVVPPPVVEPPVPDPCPSCWCIYTVEWWALPNAPPADPDNREYFALHCEELLPIDHEEILGPPIGTHVIPDPSWQQELTAYGGPLPNGYTIAAGFDKDYLEWDPLPTTPGAFLPGVARTNEILGAVYATGMGYWNSQLTMLNWKTRFNVNTSLGGIVLFAVTWDITETSGNAGWPWAVGNAWETTGQSSITPPALSRSTVVGTETITVPAFLGGIECYKVETEAWADTDGDKVPDTWVASGTNWWSNDYGCAIKKYTPPGALYDGYETQDMIWYCADPPFPPWEP